MTADLDALAAKLTPAQRTLLMNLPVKRGVALIDCWPSHGLNAHIVSMHSMRFDRLTPLGLALRARLSAGGGE